MTTSACQNFLRKVREADQDLRGMAVSDLLNSLKDQNSQLGKDDGEQYAEALIKALQDAQSYVQNLAMECLVQLVKHVAPSTTQAAIISICNRIQDAGKEAGKTALSVALRVVIGRIAENSEDKGMIAHMATPVVKTLDATENLPTDVMVDIFGALFEILAHAGAHLAADAEAVANVQTLLLKYINNESIPVRRRAIEALGKFVVNVPGERSDQALTTIFERYQNSNSDNDTAILLRVLVTIIRQRPSRVEDLVPVIVDTELEVVDDGERARRVVSLVAFETIVRHCPALVKQRRDDIYQIAVNALTYDPNYYDEDAANSVMETGSDEDLGEFGDEFDEEIYEDDEDDSWDVRLNGVKLVTTFIKSNMFTSDEIVAKIGDRLIDRFREREDIVRAEILLSYATALDYLKAQFGASLAADMDVECRAPELLRAQAPRAVSALISAIKNYTKSTETKQLSFAIFSRLIAIDGTIIDASLSNISPLVTATLAADDTAGALKTASTSLVKTNLKLDALDFLLTFVGRKDLPDSAANFLLGAMDGIKKSVSSKTFQAPTTSLDVANALVKLLRLSVDHDGRDITPFNGWIHDMADIALLHAGGNDQALSKSSYVLLGTLMQQFGNMTDASIVDKSLAALTTWKQGVNQNLDSIVALTTAVSKPTHLPAEKVLAIAQKSLIQADELLSKNYQATVAAGLGLINCLAEYDSDALSGLGDSILQHIIGVINGSPVSPPPLALQAFAKVCPRVPESTIQSIAPSLIKLLSAAIIYDSQSADALKELFQSVGRSFPDQVAQWSACIMDNWTKEYMSFVDQRTAKNNAVIQMQFPSQMLSNAAKSILGLYNGYFEAKGQPWSGEFLTKHIGAASVKLTADIGLTCLALRALGYASIRGVLAQDSSLVSQIRDLVSSKDDDIRSEAATAMGNYAGSHPDMLPELFEHAAAASDVPTALGLFQAVKVAVDYVVGSEKDSAVASQMWPQIVQYVQRTQKSIADTIAQSLAVFAISFPETYVPLLASSIDASGGNIHAKVVFITAFRTLLADKQLSSACEEQIRLVLPSVLSNISDSDINIRRLSLLAMYTIIQTRPALIKDIVGAIQPSLFKQTIVDKSLIREIQMGPYKRQVDDGLEARKCAYQCVYMLVRNMHEQTNGDDVVDCVVRGIVDEQEIRVVVQQITSESVSKLTGAYAAHMEEISSAIEKILCRKVQPKAVKQEIEKFEEEMRSTVAILIHLEPATKLPGCNIAKYTEMTAFASKETEGKMRDHYREFADIAAAAANSKASN
ncbi:SCF complex assembly [Coemansia interrupta]|uniref:SCF complex assembly n=1 Tax=Coemansia interrupta TaxID=1126814 RepID=A0A9W8HJF3_9FUNG|nr:SCF complex assembly [Coemansia interrupta]